MSQKMEDVISSGELMGYEQRWPAGEGAVIDMECAKDSNCPECKTQMEYKPWVNDKGSYRAFAVCPKCDECFEF